jgi:hypothetical protein
VVYFLVFKNAKKRERGDVPFPALVEYRLHLVLPRRGRSRRSEWRSVAKVAIKIPKRKPTPGMARVLNGHKRGYGGKRVAGARLNHLLMCPLVLHICSKSFSKITDK